MLLNIFILFGLIISGTSAWDEESSEFFEEEEQTRFFKDIEKNGNKDNVKVLITSTNGMQFSKENNPDGTKTITYDCFLGLSSRGEIHAGDKIHPAEMRSLLIQNCDNITLLLCRRGDYDDYFRLEELTVDNVKALTVTTDSNLCRNYNSYPSRGFYPYPSMFSAFGAAATDVNITISNCKSLRLPRNAFSGVRELTKKGQSFSLTLQNVLIDTLDSTACSDEDANLAHLRFKNVRIKVVEEEAVSLKKNDRSTLTVENSHFEYVRSNAFVINGTSVKIHNNKFKFLNEKAFSINATQSFLFSNNSVNVMRNPFYLCSPDVEIVGNNFDSALAPWISKIKVHNENYGVVNISMNIMRNLPQNFFYMNPENLPDIVFFHKNYFNCSCKYLSLFRYKTEDVFTRIFVNKMSENVCVNLGNCPLNRVIGKIGDLCSGKFQCPENDETDDEAEHLKSILSVLHNIDNKLDYFIARYNSSLTDENELITNKTTS